MVAIIAMSFFRVARQVSVNTVLPLFVLASMNHHEENADIFVLGFMHAGDDKGDSSYLENARLFACVAFYNHWLRPQQRESARTVPVHP